MMTTSMNYEEATNWIIAEDKFNRKHLGKCEAIMCLGNGYLGLRSATEERYVGEQRNLFVAGTFNKFDEQEVTELPNAADLIAMDITINGEDFSLETGTIDSYKRSLNLKTGELRRSIVWTSPKQDQVRIDFYRVVSMKDIHIISQKIVLQPLNNDIQLTLRTGIDGKMSNNGSQHFSEGEKRLYDKKYMQYVQTTSQSRIDFVFNTTVSFKKALNASKTNNVNGYIGMSRRYIFCDYIEDILKGQVVVIEKTSNVFTSRDKDMEGLFTKDIQEQSLCHLIDAAEKGYDFLAGESSKAWEEKLWDQVAITIESEDEFDQLAIRFAQYHLAVMTPAHDNRMNIAAKGLSGQGYKGHTFWDTDIFVLPYFTFTMPQVAKKLVEYRALSLEGAHRKAKSNGYEGAQYPWESAWLDDGEVTPAYGDADIVTGTPQKILSGLIEQHITADISYATWQYYMATQDEVFMDEYGYEMIFDTAKFWVSRLEYNQEDKLYHIYKVIGPDEYKELVDDNAYTNYMAYWNIKKAIECYEDIAKNKPDILATLNKKLDLILIYEQWKNIKEFIFLPKPREDGVIPQDSTYLSLQEIDLTKYKKQEQVLGIYRDYNAEQINHIQVSKQADVLILFYLLEDYFTEDMKQANWDYYEPRTLHDSSLSLSTHCIIANDLQEKERAYEFFQKACRIDLGENMKSSNEGIHSASIGGIWQSVVFGFAGLRLLNGHIRIQPVLPKHWNSIQFRIMWHGEKLDVYITHNQINIHNLTATRIINLNICGADYEVNKEIIVKY